MNKSKKYAIYVILLILSIALLIYSSIKLNYLLKEQMEETFVFTFLIIISILFIIFLTLQQLFFAYILRFKKKNIAKNYELYYDEYIASLGVGIIFFNNNYEIIWTSQFIDKIFQKNIIGSNLLNLEENITKKIEKRFNNFILSLNNMHYSVFINYENLIISFKDVTEQENLYKLQWKKQNVFGEMEIDNFEQLQARLSINDMFQIYLNITNTLDKLSKEYDLIFHQYSQGKFFILTNYEILKSMINNSFSFLDTIKKNNPIKNIELSFSLGFAADFKTQTQLLNHSKKALEQAQTRGGDQVVVQFHNSPPSYYGAVQKLEATFSKVEIKQFAKHFYNFLNQKTIKNVIIYGHINADLDAIGAAMGIYEIAKQCNKRAYIQNQIIDETTSSYIKKNFDESLKKIFITSKQATKLTNSNTAIIIVDTSDFSRIENSKALFKADLNNVFIIDHHRLGKYLDQILPTNIYINPNSSSTSEIVTEILTYINPIYNKFNAQTLQMLLNGIYLDTQFFRKNVSFATFNIASWLEKKGAKIAIATNILKIPKTYATIIHQILSDIEEIKPNYFLAMTKKELPDNIISIIANEILKVENRKAAFVIAKIPNSKQYKLSARSNDVNVQVIAEAVGGGGHYDSAAAITNDELEVFRDNLIQAIISRTTKIDYKL